MTIGRAPRPARLWRSRPLWRAAAYVSLPWLGLLWAPPTAVFAVAAASVVAAVFVARDLECHRDVLRVIAGLTVCDVSPLSVDGSVVRLYQLAAPVLLAVVLRRWRPVVAGLRDLSPAASLLLLVLLVVTLVTAASGLWTISPEDTLISTVGQLSATGLLVVYAGAVRAGLLRAVDVLEALWAVATVGSGVALVQFAVTLTTPVDWAMAGGSGVPWPRPTGLMTEGVWAALVAAVGLALSAYVRRASPRQGTAGLAVNGLVIALVASRAVLLGLLVAAIACAVVAWRHRVTVRVAVVSTVGFAVVVAGVAALAPQFAARFDPRLVLGLQSSADGGSANSRAAVYDLAGDELPALLPLGGGAGSLNKLTTDGDFRDRYIGGGELNSGRGSTNFYLGFIFDFGYLGGVLALALTGLVGLLALRATRWDGGLSVFLATLLLVDFQFNNGFRFGFVHVLLGLLLAIQVRRSPQRADVREGTYRQEPTEPALSGLRSRSPARPGRAPAAPRRYRRRPGRRPLPPA